MTRSRNVNIDSLPQDSPKKTKNCTTASAENRFKPGQRALCVGQAMTSARRMQKITRNSPSSERLAEEASQHPQPSPSSECEQRRQAQQHIMRQLKTAIQMPITIRSYEVLMSPQRKRMILRQRRGVGEGEAARDLKTAAQDSPKKKTRCKHDSSQLTPFAAGLAASATVPSVPQAAQAPNHDIHR